LRAVAGSAQRLLLARLRIDFRCAAQGFWAFEPAQIHEIPLFPAKSPRNPQKTCGNKPFPIDKRFAKTQGKRRGVLPDPRQHWLSRCAMRFGSSFGQASLALPARSTEMENTRRKTLWQQR
jgi:hypothetical protein